MGEDAGDLRGRAFRGADLSGARFEAVDLRGARSCTPGCTGSRCAASSWSTRPSTVRSGTSWSTAWTSGRWWRPSSTGGTRTGPRSDPRRRRVPGGVGPERAAVGRHPGRGPRARSCAAAGVGAGRVVVHPDAAAPRLRLVRAAREQGKSLQAERRRLLREWADSFLVTGDQPIDSIAFSRRIREEREQELTRRALDGDGRGLLRLGRELDRRHCRTAHHRTMTPSGSCRKASSSTAAAADLELATKAKPLRRGVCPVGRETGRGARHGRRQTGQDPERPVPFPARSGTTSGC